VRPLVLKLVILHQQPDSKDGRLLWAEASTQLVVLLAASGSSRL